MGLVPLLSRRPDEPASRPRKFDVNVLLALNTCTLTMCGGASGAEWPSVCDPSIRQNNLSLISVTQQALQGPGPI